METIFFGSVIPKKSWTSPINNATAGIGSASVAKNTVQQPRRAIIIFMLNALTAVVPGPSIVSAIEIIDCGVGITQIRIKTRRPIPNHLKSVVLSKPPSDSFLSVIINKKCRS